MHNHIKTCLAFALVLLCCGASAQLRLPKVIGDNMVMQCKQEVPVWGRAAQNSPVTVKFGGQVKSTTANADGYWKVYLSPLKASATPAQMRIASGKDSIILHHILVGEVWLCAGQSNMEYPMKGGYSQAPPKRGADSAALALATHNPLIRLFKIERKLNVPDVQSTGWQECGGTSLEQFSAFGYFFAKNLQQKLNVPVGMIESAWGATQIEQWTPAEAYINAPVFNGELNPTTHIMNGVEAGKIYDSMVKPLAPFAIRGWLWYQGESNCITHDGMHYADKMQAIIKSWREAWGGKLPFYYVTLAPCYYTHRKDPLKHTPETLPEIWEAQTAALHIPNTEMVPTSDLVDILGDIHPSYKWEVGRRLAILAFNKQYGLKHLEYTGPRFKSIKVKGHHLVITFTHADGLKTSDGQPVNWLEITGEGGKRRQAQAQIKGNKLIVYSRDITSPQQIFFGWNEIAQPNLMNSAGLPAMPFHAETKHFALY